MKLILMLLLLSFSLSCFSQENDRATILKNKVKSVKTYCKERNHSTYIEYNKDGWVSIKIDDPYRSLVNTKELLKYEYKDSVLIMKIEKIIKEDAIVSTDTTFYEYDNLGRLLNVYSPIKYHNINGRKWEVGSLEKYFYIDSFSNNISRINTYSSDTIFTSSQCNFIINDKSIFYLSGYKLYKYLDSSNNLPTVYTFSTFSNDNYILKSKYLNLEIDKKYLFSDTLIKKIKQGQPDEMNKNKIHSFCENNEILGTGFIDEVVILERLKSSKLIERTIKDISTVPNDRIELFYYTENGLINIYKNKYTFYNSCARNQVVDKNDETWEYSYEYFK